MFSKGGPTLFELIHQGLSSTRRGYDLLAPKFDLTPFRTPDELLEIAVREIGKADSALDVCCGTGAGMQFLRPICRDRIVGIDFSPGMLEQAKRNLAHSKGTANVELIEGDVKQMKFREEFDLTTCFGALGHIPEKDASEFLRVIYRALKPGGRFVFFTAHPPPFFSLQGFALRTFNGAMRIRNALIKPPFIMYYLTFSLPGVVETLEREGFSVDVRPNVCREHCLVIATRDQRPLLS